MISRLGPTDIKLRLYFRFNNCKGSYKTEDLANDYNTKVRNMQRHIKYLIDHGLIKSSTYRASNAEFCVDKVMAPQYSSELKDNSVLRLLYLYYSFAESKEFNTWYEFGDVSDEYSIESLASSLGVCNATIENDLQYLRKYKLIGIRRISRSKNIYKIGRNNPTKTYMKVSNK